MKKLSRLLVPVCFTAFLFIVLAATLLRPIEYTSYFENRDLALFPSLTVESVLDGSFFTGLEEFFIDHCAGRNTLLKIKTKLDLDVFSRPLVNTVVVTDDELLQQNSYTRSTDESIAVAADAITENLAGISSLVESCGGTYYYVAVPNQGYARSDGYPWYMANAAGDYERYILALSSRLSDAGVNFIDIGEAYSALGNPDYLTSPVDNHFSMYGAFLTYQTVMDRINADTGLGLSVLRDEDVTFTALPDYYMGSRTRMLINLRKNSDCLTLLTPKTDVPFDRFDDGEQVEATVYTMPTDTDWVTYGVYMNGDIAETVIDTGRDSLPSILVYGDSFTNGVECIIYNSFNVMRSLDLRHYDEMSLSEYIELYRPDVVICIRDYSVLLDSANNGSGTD